MPEATVPEPASPCSQRGNGTWVVVPMYNESETIATVVAELRQFFTQVVCVDDGSSDDCADLASLAGATVLRHPINLGQGAALRTGMEFALRYPNTQFVVSFDADGQHDVADVLAMLELASSTGADVVLGSRFLGPFDSSASTMRRLTLKAAVVFTRWTTGMRLSDTHNGLRVFTRRAAGLMQIRLHRMAHASEILNIIARERLTYLEAPVVVRYTQYSRGKGQTNLNAVNIVFDLLMQKLEAAT